MKYKIEYYIHSSVCGLVKKMDHIELVFVLAIQPYPEPMSGLGYSIPQIDFVYNLVSVQHKKKVIPCQALKLKY